MWRGFSGHGVTKENKLELKLKLKFSYFGLSE